MPIRAPSFQFYPADWLNDSKLATCPLEAKGLLIDLMCLIHQSERYGYLLINGQPPSDVEVNRVVRCQITRYRSLSQLLIQRGVLRVDENGLIYSKRMVEDDKLRQIRRECGEKGGNPKLRFLDNQKVNHDGYPPCTPPSSSSSSSSSKEKDKSSSPLIRRAEPNDNGKDAIPQKSITNKWPPTLIPTTEEKKELAELCIKVNQKYPQFNSFAWIQKHIDGHPSAHVHVLKSLLDNKAKSPWAYADQIFDIENGNYNEADHIKASQELKKSTPTIGDALRGAIKNAMPTEMQGLSDPIKSNP